MTVPDGATVGDVYMTCLVWTTHRSFPAHRKAAQSHCKLKEK